jgi:hypothetical protein
MNLSLGPLLERRTGAMTGLTQRSPIPGGVDTSFKIAALWIAMLFIFAYVDLFSLYRPDMRADLEAGRLFAFNDVGRRSPSQNRSSEAVFWWSG